MKPKYCLLVFVLLTLSCKVTEKNIVGSYNTNDTIYNKLYLNANHTFLFTHINYARYFMGPIKHIYYNLDSIYFATSGKWELGKNKLILMSYDNNLTDTNRVRSVVKTSKTSGNSNFSFRDINGEKIGFNKIDDEKGNFAFIVHHLYYNFDVDLNKHQLLIFYFYLYKPWGYKINDRSSANYIITLAPYYYPAFFKNKIFLMRKNRIYDNKIKYKKDKRSKNDPML